MLRPRFWCCVVATAAGLSAGCGRSPAEVPAYDQSGGATYGVVPFKDDAPPNATLPGDQFPATFVDTGGNPVDLTKYRGRRVVLVVLRGIPKSTGGAFCPSCLAQAGSLITHQKEFAGRGVAVLVVFPGPDERLGEFIQAAKRNTPGEPEWNYPLLLDRDCTACDRLGIRDDLAKPSTYILDTRGNVVYAYVGETTTDRPSVVAILKYLDRTR